MATFAEMYDFRFLNTADTLQKQYEMMFFEESKLSVTWTIQHGAGSQKLNSHMVLQFICDTFPRATSAGTNGFGPTGTVDSFFGTGTGAMNGVPNRADARRMRRHGLRVELVNGGNTDTPTEPNFDAASIQNAYTTSNGNTNGRRESEEYYAYCKERSANHGLFHADQKLQGYTQKFTRQNPGGTRRGLECPEERDYYPWWNPSPFHDIAVITDDVDYCESTLAANSQNVVEKYQCVRDDTSSNAVADWIPSTDAIAYNLNQTLCEAEAGHSWEGFRWYGSKPECVESFWSKVNHLGNVDNTKRGGKMAHYDWQLPSYDELTQGHMCYAYKDQSLPQSDASEEDYSTTANCVRMMFRIRYNISTMDYDPYKTNSSMDEDDNEGIISPIENNPTVDVGVYAQGLRLAINTAQTGRTFQDNTHTFLVCERPSNFDGDNILNVGVRGKRGNIVQTFPAIEYDFEPKHIFVSEGDCLHFQWTGSNTHNNGAPGGDGQTGDAGEGRGGSDRSTLTQTLALDQSYPLTYDKDHDGVEKFFEQVTCRHPFFPNTNLEDGDAELILGTAGFYRSVNDAISNIEASSDDDGFVDVLLNNASASFRQGLICCVNNGAKEAEYNFISTRNNNFTNRSQKLKIVITDDKEPEDQW
jgi:plastocyanin